ncbi:MAG TPA: glutathione binding-like protein, partial [Xanthobacteraceae bacterium]
RFTIADIALYAYTHVANRCDFDLSRFPAINAWLSRIAAEPGHVTMEWQPEALSAAQ